MWVVASRRRCSRGHRTVANRAGAGTGLKEDRKSVSEQSLGLAIPSEAH